VPTLSKTQFPLQIDGFDARYGLEILSLGEEEATGRVAVTAAAMQPAGLVHGGVYAAIAESLATRAAGDRAVRGLSTQTSFLRPITRGTVHATARRRHSGRTTAVWEVDISDDEGRLCALVRATVALRERSAG
jgi:1,4-dihydroxy-2-naphthoyl-CoA hydrolase